MGRSRFWLDSFNPPIASQFDEALSYQEQIRRLYKKVYECLEWVRGNLAGIGDKIERETLEEVRRYMKKKLEEFQEANDGSFQELARRMDSLDKRLTVNSNGLIAVKNILESQIQLVADHLDEAVNNFDDMIQMEAEHRISADNYLQEQIRENKEYTINLVAAVVEAQGMLQVRMREVEEGWLHFKDEMQKRFGGLEAGLSDLIESQLAKVNGDRILVENPVTGNRDSLKKTLKDIYAYKVPFPIRVDEFNALSLKVEDFNRIEIKVEEFNDKAALIFLKHSQDNDAKKMATEALRRVEALESVKWFSAISMKDLSPYQAYLELASMVIDINGEPSDFDFFNNLGLIFEEFNGKMITVDQFNFNAKKYLR